MPVNTTIKIRKGTASQWTTNGSTILASGEPGYEIDTGRLKIGDGSTTWSSLNYSSVVPTGFLSGSGINLSLGANGSSLTISATGLQTTLTNPITGTGTANYISQFSSTSGLSNSVIYQNSSKIGINTTTPTGDLHVVGTGIVSNVVGIGVSSITAFGGPYYLATPPALHVSGATNISGVLTARSGNFINTLAVNTTTPSGNLHVIGTGIVSNAIGVGVSSMTGFNGPYYLATPPALHVSGATNLSGLVTATSGNFINTLAVNTTTPSGNLHVIGTGIVSNAVGIGVSSMTGFNGPYYLATPPALHVSGSTNVSGLLTATSGSFTNSLSVSGTSVSIAGHTHTSSAITDFNSSVSGLLPVKNISSGSGINVSSTSGNFTISVSGLNSTYISDFNEAIDDRIGSGLFVAGTGISLDYNDSGNSFTVAVTGLIANPSNNRILTSRDNTTTGIDAESDLTFENKTLNIGSSGNAGPEAIINLYTNDGGDGQPAINFKDYDDNTKLKLYWNDDENTSHVYSYDSLVLSGPTNYIIINNDGTINIVSSGVTSNNNFGIINQTANTIASFDTNKNIVSLATGTYPNLTELSYVKGVTSSIQTQLNGKAASSHTHTTSDITNFNSSVSGLLPSISGSSNINVSSSNNTYTISATGLQTTLTNPITGTGTTNYISKWTSSSGLNNSNIYDDGTNIGIATISPSYKLDINGTIRSSGDVRIHGPINSTGALHFTSAYANNATATIFCDRDTNWGGVLRIQTPRTNGGFGGQNGLVMQTLDDPTGYPNQNTHISINTMSNTANTSAVLYIGSGNATTNTRNSLYTEKGVILAANSGNVGIGTSSPSYPLHVAGSGYLSSGLVLGSSTTSGLITGLSNTGTIPAISFNSVSANHTAQTTHSVFEFKKNGTRTHWIDGLGNFQCDTAGSFLAQSTTPASNLQCFIGNGMRRYSSTNGFDFAWGENISSTTEPGFDLFPIGGTHITSGILFRLSKDSAKTGVALLVNGNGRVGIGTSTPSYALHTVGTGYFSQNLLVGGTAVSLNGHTHNPSDITNLVANQADNRVLTSIGYSNNINAENNLTFDGTNLVITSGTAQRVIQGSTVSFSKANYAGTGVYDPIISGSLHIARDNANGIFNVALESGYDTNNYISPSGTEWNWDGWSNLHNFKTRTYTTFYYALNQAIGNNVVGAELIMRHIPTQRYWKVKFSSWTQGGNGGGFAYDRNELYLSDFLDETYPTYTNGTLLIGSGTSLVPNTLSAGSNIGITNGSGTITISATGFQTTLTNPITGTGSTNYVSKFSSTSGLSNSIIYENGNKVGIGTSTPSGQLHVIGTGIFSTGVGINTDAPTAPLHVVGSGIIASGLFTNSITPITGTGNLVGSWTLDSNKIRTQTLASFSALDNQPPATSFATLDTRNSIAVLNFDDSTSESGIFVGVIPDSAALGSGINIRVNWMAISATSGTCSWGAQFEKMNTDADTDSFDTTGSEASSTTNATCGIPTVTTITCTGIDSLAAGDFFRMRIYRAAADAVNDTMVGDAQLISVELRSVS